MDKIAIDFTFVNGNAISRDKITGSIAVFLADILDGIACLHKEDKFVILANSDAAGNILDRFPSYQVIPVGNNFWMLFFKLFSNGYYGRKLKKKGLFDKKVKQFHISKIWYPWMVPEETAGTDVEYVGTCHDMKMRWANSDESCKAMFVNALHTITISGFVKKELLEIYGIDSNRITSIYNGLSLASGKIETSEIKKLTGKKYILSINAYAKEKNIITLLKAFNHIKAQIDYDLIICGGYTVGKTLEELQNYVKENSLGERVCFYLNIPETERNWLLKNCELFVTTSENEGFGRTPIEAALCMKPVISTRSASLEEVTLGLVHYYNNSRDENELALAIVDLINNPDTTERLEYIREQFVKLYSPTAVAAKYLELFGSIKWI